jgi:membrane protein
MTIADPTGRLADDPREVGAEGWKAVARRTRAEVKQDNVALLAAGVAFYALLSLVPALAALVSVYGLVADPADVDRQVGDMLAAAPAEVRDLVAEQMAAVTDSSGGGLGLTAVAGVLIALWSASSGMKHLIEAINVAYDEEETRGFLALRLRAVAFTVGAVGFVVVSVGAITALPDHLVVSLLRWPLLGAGLVVGLALLYRYGPDREEPRWAWTAPGTLVATVTWLVGSLAFSVYTANVGSYGETYGALGAVVVLMLWLMLSAFAVVVGAEINAEAEHQALAP